MLKKILIKEENGIRYFNNGDWIDLNDMPRNKGGHINWCKSIGRKIKIKYNEKIFEIKIIEYINKRSRIVFICQGNKYDRKVSSILDCRFDYINNTLRYKYNIGDEIKNIKILGREIIKVNDKQTKTYTIINSDNNEIIKTTERKITAYENRNTSIKKKKRKGSPIATARPNLLKYFVNEQDAYNNTLTSKNTILVKCPICNFEKEIKVKTLVSIGFNCNKCGEHYSYPNRLITELLCQLKVKFKNEKTFKWSDGKVYDFYIPSKEIIIEAHGRQHYDGGFSRMGGRTLEEEQQNDKLKCELALQNDVKHYVQLDCSKSNIDYIKNNIMNSELPTLLNFKENDIDWNECDKNASSSLMIKACELWDSGIHNTKEIGKIIHRSYAMVIEYLKHGVELGLCDYTIEESRKKDDTKHIYVYDKDLNFIKEFLSCRQLEELSEEIFGTKFINQCVIRVCLGQRKQYKGYIFSYIPLHKDITENR